MANIEKAKANRVALRDWFIENPSASLDQALNVALKQDRALGLTKVIATGIRQEAREISAHRAALQAEAAKLEAENAALRAKAGELARQVVHTPPPSPPTPPLAVYSPAPDADREDEGTWLGAVRHVLGLFAEGEILSVSDAHHLGAELGPKPFWRGLLERLTTMGKLEKAPGKDQRGPHATILWAAKDPEWCKAMGNASDEVLAGVVWEGPASVAAVEVAVPESEREEPEVVAAPGAPPLTSNERYLATLIEAQLKLTQGMLEAIQLVRDEIADLRRLL